MRVVIASVIPVARAPFAHPRPNGGLVVDTVAGTAKAVALRVEMPV